MRNHLLIWTMIVLGAVGFPVATHAIFYQHPELLIAAAFGHDA